MARLRYFGLLALVLAAFAMIAASCGGDDDNGGGGAVEALPSASCGPIRYEGEGEPDVLIASDLPLQGANRALTTEMADAIEFVLSERDWKAGDLNVGYQSCDDSTAQAGSWDSAKCTSNARAYAENESVIGVVGTFNSGCAKLVIPVLNRAPNGPLAMVSPSNTNPGLTEPGPGADPGAPDIFYPTQTRNYARVVWNDQHQGAANALFAQEQGYKNVYILNDAETYGLGVATLFARAAESLGIKVAGNNKWDKKATSYEPLASRVKASGADAVFLGGIVCNNGGKLIKDLRATLGDEFPIFGPDGWTPIEDATVKTAGPASEGMFISQPGVPIDQLAGAGKEFADGFEAEHGKSPDPYTAYAAQAAVVLLEAIDRGGNERAKVSEELFNTDIKDGILGDFAIDDNGDTSLGTVSFFQVQSGKGEFVKGITPDITPEGDLNQ
ncbi:MAG: branched-chain amino acid ABC transporter substrate-binding protein [Gaiellaceae bacterium]